MKGLLHRLLIIEFEARIFVSFSIIAGIALVSFLTFRSMPTVAVLLGRLTGLAAETSQRWGFIGAAVLTAAGTILRMWAGSVLTSQRMMSFPVQQDALKTSGPYRLVRNPIYLADLIAFAGFVLCLRPVGLLWPLLLYLHYTRLVKYEEESLGDSFDAGFQAYLASAPSFIPDRRSIRQLGPALREFYINADGARHNALFLLFVPGFITAAVTGSLLHAVLIGLPAVVDWAVVHTRKGLAARPGKA